MPFILFCVSKQKPLPTIPTNDNDNDDDANVRNNNAENGDEIRNVERPLPPLPLNDSRDRIDESPDDSEIEDDIEDDSDTGSSDELEDDDDEQTTNECTKLLNGTSSNGTNEYEDSFNADATLPPSPTKTSNTSITELIDSHEVPSSPENDRLTILTFQIVFIRFAFT